MTKLFNKLKKPYFLVHFPHFWEKKTFFKKLALSRTSHGLLTPYQNLEKANEPIPRKLADGRMDGQTLLHRTLPAIAGGPEKPKEMRSFQQSCRL